MTLWIYLRSSILIKAPFHCVYSLVIASNITCFYILSKKLLYTLQYLLYYNLLLFTDTDECLSNPCMNGGICTDGKNSYRCVCLKQYTGSRCETGLYAIFCTKSLFDEWTEGIKLNVCNNLWWLCKDGFIHINTIESHNNFYLLKGRENNYEICG